MTTLLQRKNFFLLEVLEDTSDGIAYVNHAVFELEQDAIDKGEQLLFWDKDNERYLSYSVMAIPIYFSDATLKGE